MSAAIDRDVNGINLDDVSLCALSTSTREYLCHLLNSEKLIPTEDNLLRDWRGLAQLIGVSTPTNESNPTDKVLKDWIVMTREGTPRPTIGVLLSFLGQIDRWDVFDDIKDRMEADANKFLVKKDTLSPPSSGISERDVITIDDYSRYKQGLPLQTYDAFFLYVDQDASFANEIVSILEDEFGLRLCLRDRDLVGGLMFEHDAIMRLIANRCAQLIVIISEHYINSEEHKFFFKFAQALSIQQGKRKIIPLVRNASGLEIPNEFKFYFLLDLNRHSSIRSFCNRLRNSIQPLKVFPALAAPSIVESRCTIEELPSEVKGKVSVSPGISEVPTVVFPMSDPSAFLSSEKSKSDVEASENLGSTSSTSKTSVSKPVSPALIMRNMFRSKKSPQPEMTAKKNVLPKSKKGRSWTSSKKKDAVAES